MIQILKADARSLPLLDESVDCIVTSPPYWSLRDYGVAGQIGLETSPGEYVAQIVAAFRECHRVLKTTGTAWLVLGDSYAGGGNYRGIHSEATLTDKQRSNRGARGLSQALGAAGKDFGLASKQLVGIPWRVAFALQGDGWWLRSDSVWSKPNPMPESIKDRPTRSHEYVFLLAKAERYFYDAAAIAEPAGPFRPAGRNNACDSPRTPDPRKKQDALGKRSYTGFNARWAENPTESRNARSDWTIATQPYSGAHFATFPEELARRCIVAGCPQGGIVLDPFAGSGTVGKVAIATGRRAILCDLSYHRLSEKRCKGVQMPLGEAG